VTQLFNLKPTPQGKLLKGAVKMNFEFDDSLVEQTADRFKAMSHPIRLKIMALLEDKELSVQELVDSVGTSQSNISQHLLLMRNKDILLSRRDANQVFYRLGDCRIPDFIDLANTTFCKVPN
jgi:DNA-binding transcriptional ArsR family regulator